MTVYVVSGFMRSLTSAMMGALNAGGLEACYDQDKYARFHARRTDGYEVNPEFYELPREAYLAENFPLEYDGKLIKCLWPGFTKHFFDHPDTFAVFMRRPRAEIEASMLKVWGNTRSLDRWSNRWEELMDHTASFMSKKLKSFTQVWVSDLTKDPLSVFKVLYIKGWPIDPYKSADHIDLTKVRFSSKEADNVFLR